ncbi:3,4-dihydroxy-2-butanone-4-phosphate synthase [Rhodococcus sp. 14C212]|uniref:3,4-dihydroxy-2-butanone-4-phosphate synthase n=1 Tax=Rhodococcus sp. 14C212 TaxID=2711209 RepID=UPI003211EBBE
MSTQLADASSRHHIDEVPAALDALCAGRPVLVLDDSDRENEGDVVLAAAMAEPSWVAWMVRHTSGLLCAPLPAARADELHLPPMVGRNTDPRGTAYAVSVDAARGVSTGISATDRAHTAQVLADPFTLPTDLSRPGHVLPLRARPGGVLERRGHTEAGVDLCQLAGLPPVALIAELVNDDGTMSRRPDILELASRTELPMLDIDALVTHRLYHGDGRTGRVSRVASTRLPSAHGGLRAIGYRDEITGAEHLALLGEDPAGTYPLVAIHHECLLGDAFGSLRCNCGGNLGAALDQISTQGGVLLYLRAGQGHLNSVLRDGHQCSQTTTSSDAAAAAILADLGFSDVRLLDGPTTASGLTPGGIGVVDRIVSPPLSA